MKQVLVKIPFGGFYCSLWSEEIDDIESNEIEYYNEEHKTEKTWDDFEIDYEKIHNEISQDYCHYWGQQLSQKVSFDSGEDFEIYFTFDSIESPRYYNFETDKIFAYCDFEKLKELYNLSESYKKDFEVWLYERMKPCDGFIPFYSNVLDDWGEFEEWNTAQYGLLLEWFDSAFIEEFDLFDDMRETMWSTVTSYMELKD